MFPVACATGCRACTGPNNADCMACEDETLYRVTTNQPSSSACVTAAACDDTAISTFGDRTCSNLRETSQVSCNCWFCIEYGAVNVFYNLVTLFVAGRRRG